MKCYTALLLSLYFAFTFTLKAQPTFPKNTIFTQPEVPATFPGGEAAFGKFLGDHIVYPVQAKNKKIQGRVLISFVVERNGSLTDIKVLRDPGAGLGNEAVRVLKLSPNWKPGRQSGRPVRVQFTIPINFSL